MVDDSLFRLMLVIIVAVFGPIAMSYRLPILSANQTPSERHRKVVRPLRDRNDSSHEVTRRLCSCQSRSKNSCTRSSGRFSHKAISSGAKPVLSSRWIMPRSSAETRRVRCSGVIVSRAGSESAAVVS